MEDSMSEEYTCPGCGAAEGDMHDPGCPEWMRRVNVLTEPEGKTPTKDLPFLDITPEMVACLLVDREDGSGSRVSKWGLPYECEVRQAVLINRAVGPKACAKGTQILRLYLELPEGKDYEDAGFSYWLPGVEMTLRPVEMERLYRDEDLPLDQRGNHRAVILEKGSMPRSTQAALNVAETMVAKATDERYAQGVQDAVRLVRDFYKGVKHEAGA